MSDILDDRSYSATTSHQHQPDPQAKQKKFVKVFGWITFGFSCWYILSSIWGIFSALMGNTFSEINNLPGVDIELINQMETMMAWQAIIAVYALVLAVFFMIGSLKFVKYEELGRKMMIFGYIGAILHVILGMMVLWFGFDMEEIFSAAQMGGVPEMDKVAGMASSMFMIVKVVSSIFQIAIIVFFAWLIMQFNLDRIKALFKK